MACAATVSREAADAGKAAAPALTESCRLILSQACTGGHDILVELLGACVAPCQLASEHQFREAAAAWEAAGAAQPQLWAAARDRLCAKMAVRGPCSGRSCLRLSFN
jgi:hypothetical protein